MQTPPGSLWGESVLGTPPGVAWTVGTFPGSAPGVCWCQAWAQDDFQGEKGGGLAGVHEGQVPSGEH